MGYHVDYDSLRALSSSVYSQSQSWLSALETLNNATTTLVETDRISGQGADAIRSYMESVHSTIQTLLGQLISLHWQNCMLYKDDYITNIDTGLHTVIKQTELSSISNALASTKQKALSVDDELRYTLNGIRDIFSVSYNDVTNCADAHQAAVNSLSELDSSIAGLEAAHTGQDFVNTGDMILRLTAMIQELLGHDRSYKSDFSPELLAMSTTFQELYASYVNVNAELQEQASAIETAIENENEQIAELQAEYEERQKTANAINWIVTGLCVVGSVVAIAATGGAATPLVVGAISAASGAIIAGTGNLTAQYVEHGNLIDNADQIDWASFGKDVVVAGVAGFATGYISAGLGGAITDGLSKTATGSALLHSTNAATRIGTQAAIGATSEVVSGIASRGAGTLISTGNLGEAVQDAFSGQDILLDATLGGANGAFSEYTSLKKAQEAADASAADYNNRYKPLDAGEANGLTGLKSTQNGGVDFSDSDYILRTEAGDPIEIKIKSTGNRAEDYKLAEKILKEEYGIDIDFKSMRTGQDKTHVWHHMDDYDVMTNETTMQFVEIDAHKAIENHSGSAKQYHTAHGQGYGKQAFDPNYQGTDVLKYATPVINEIQQNLENIEAIGELNPVPAQ